MNDLDLSKLNAKEISKNEMKETEGGFVALTILGVTYTASQVAAAAGALFVAGIGAGVAAAAATD